MVPTGEESPPPRARVNLESFLFGLLGTALASGIAFGLRLRRPDLTKTARANTLWALTAALWASALAWGAYVLYAVGWVPGATALQAGGHTWAAGAVTLIGGLLALPWLQRQTRG